MIISDTNLTRSRSYHPPGTPNTDPSAILTPHFPRGSHHPEPIICQSDASPVCHCAWETHDGCVLQNGPITGRRLLTSPRRADSACSFILTDRKGSSLRNASREGLTCSVHHAWTRLICVCEAAGGVSQPSAGVWKLRQDSLHPAHHSQEGSSAECTESAGHKVASRQVRKARRLLTRRSPPPGTSGLCPCRYPVPLQVILFMSLL